MEHAARRARGCASDGTAEAPARDRSALQGAARQDPGAGRPGRRGLRYAPLAALAAVIVPEVVMTQGHLVATLKDARLPASIAASVYYFARRDILGTIVTGMAVFLPRRIGLGW